MGKDSRMTLSNPTRSKAAAESLGASISLADALFTTTQQRVLALLFGQPDRSFYTRELIGLTGSGSGAVQRELHRLTSSGLVKMTPIGAQKHYQANPDCPVFQELVGITRKTVAMAEPIRQALNPLADHIRLAMIYGSVAKRTDTATSDIDLLVVAEDLLLEDLFAALAPVEARLDRQINPLLYTAEEFDSRRSAQSPFLSRALVGEHLILIGE